MNANTNGTELATYPALQKRPFSEAFLELLSFISDIARVVAIVLGAVLFIFLLVDTRMAISAYYYPYKPMINWLVYAWLFLLVVFVVIASVVVANYAVKERHRVYMVVPQGRIISLVMKDKGKKSLKWDLLVEGHNSVNEIRTQWRSKKTSKDDDRLAIGDFVDFRKTSAD